MVIGIPGCAALDAIRKIHYLRLLDDIKDIEGGVGRNVRVIVDAKHLGSVVEPYRIRDMPVPKIVVVSRDVKGRAGDEIGGCVSDGGGCCGGGAADRYTICLRSGCSCIPDVRRFS